ncbi:heavy metal-responsive transcriptional regulator [Nonomuraea sp. NPDC050547]|uniref:heavy metal-responsive transcriptional regulator n=1 Tax=Nonomuraea sp. NPDC050547 TaxID=3364368 RepID=UPI0037A3F4C4
MRIGTLAAEAGVSTKTIRFYEQAGLLPEPPRTSGGYRDYPAAAIDRLAFIRDAQTAGLSLAQIREVLNIRDAGQAPCEHVGELIEAHLTQVNERIDELISARSTLLALRRRAQETDPAACAPDRVCAILASRPSP